MQNHNVCYVQDAYHTLYNIQNNGKEGRYLPLVCIPLTALSQKSGWGKNERREKCCNSMKHVTQAK